LSFKYIRECYKVPARRGAQVICDGKHGVITSARYQYLRVRLEGEKRPRIYHPTDILYVMPKV